MAAEFGELTGHDAYDLLGVSPDASQQEIRRAYRTLVKAHHPDLFPDPRAKAKAEAKVRLFIAAHEILENRRAAYDAFLSAAADEEPADAEIIDDPWDAAVPGPAGAGDPWETASSGQGAVHFQWSPPPPPPPPAHRPAPPPPPRYRYAPGTGFQAPPVRMRQRPSRVGLAILGAVILFPIGTIMISAVHSFVKQPRASAAVPGRLSGTWEGKVKVVGAKKSWKVQLTLHHGKHNGDVSYLDGKCTGTAVPVRYEAGRLTVSTKFSKEMVGCDVGDLQLSRRKDGRLDIVYRSATGKVTASGVLAPRD